MGDKEMSKKILVIITERSIYKKLNPSFLTCTLNEIVSKKSHSQVLDIPSCLLLQVAP
jgi:hypothetical protein